MIVLLIALQATTHCSPDYVGGVNCTTNTPQQYQPYSYYRAPPPRQNDDAALFERMRQNGRAKTVGKMLANGDCSGALNYALGKGDFALAQQVKDYCAK